MARATNQGCQARQGAGSSALASACGMQLECSAFAHAARRPMRLTDSLRSVVRGPIRRPIRSALRVLALIMIVALCSTGCKDKAQATAGPRPGAAAAGEAAPAEPTGANLTPSRKGTGEGWRWKGNRAACMFLVGKQCFDKREAACKAAGCAGDACKISNAVPAAVSCTGK
jgi:hypothetical protein